MLLASNDTSKAFESTPRDTMWIEITESTDVAFWHPYSSLLDCFNKAAKTRLAKPNPKAGEPTEHSKAFAKINFQKVDRHNTDGESPQRCRRTPFFAPHTRRAGYIERFKSGEFVIVRLEVSQCCLEDSASPHKYPIHD